MSRLKEKLNLQNKTGNNRNTEITGLSENKLDMTLEKTNIGNTGKRRSDNQETQHQKSPKQRNMK